MARLSSSAIIPRSPLFAAIGPLIIYIKGTITNTEDYCYVSGPNKTILGYGTNAMFIGNLRLSGTNLIVRNLRFESSTNYAPFMTNDTITIDSGGEGPGLYTWVDHCTFYDAPDGALDFTKGADFLTASWNKFYYRYAAPGTPTSHQYVNLIGSSDSESQSTGKLRATFHHNWYGESCRERMPSVRHGRVHVFNNYYNSPGNNYCVRTRINAQILCESNYFANVKNPWERFDATSANGQIKCTGNITNNCIFTNAWVLNATLVPGTDAVSDLQPLPYYVAADPAASIPGIVTNYAGQEGAILPLQ